MFSGKSWMACCLPFCFLTVAVKSYPGGAPFDACLLMFPKHQGQEQSSGPPPFNITVSSAMYTPGQNITVTVSAMMGHVIRGLQVRAHRANLNVEEIVGSFLAWPEDKVQPVTCFGHLHNMVTHRNNEPTSNITLTWKAPDENLGDIVFEVTVVESFKVFWSRMSSDRLIPQDPNTVVRPIQTKPVVNTSFAPIDWASCGESKGCLLYPRHCSGADCYAAVTFTKVAQQYTFEMVAEAEGYVSVGFSYDDKMGHDQTVTCTAQGDRVSVQHGYNRIAMYTERMMGLDLSNLQVMQEDGKVYCRFTRPETMDVLYMPGYSGDVQVFPFDLSVHFHLFIAWGYTYQDTDVFGKHTEMPVVSDEKINFRHYAVYRGSSIPYPHKVHGCLMMVSWMAMAGLTVVISRYFREGRGANVCLGTNWWFQVHRLCALSVFALTVAGFVVILVHLDGDITENEKAYDHACVGLTVVASVCAQLVLGLFRPSPSSRLRPVFNWTHRLLGKSTQILSAVTMLLAFQWKWMPSVMRQFGLVVLGCWIGVQILTEIILEIWFKCNKRFSEKADINMDELEPREKPEIKRDTSMIPLLLYLLVPVGAASAGLCSLLLF